MPSLSFIYVSNRPGGMEFLAKSFSHQKDRDFELIVVDGYPGRGSRGKAADYLKAADVNLGWYGEPKPKCYPDTVTGFANAMNTGLIVAQGEWVVFVHDYCFLLDSAVEKWKQAIYEHGQKCLISGFARRYKATTEPQHWDHDIELWDKTEKGIPIGIEEDWVPEVFEIFYSGMSIEFAEHINGFDERADDHITWSLESLMVQAFIHRMRMVVDRRLDCHMVDHRQWDKGTATWNYNPQPKPEEIGWLSWSPNPFNLAEERQRYQQDRLVERGT